MKTTLSLLLFLALLASDALAQGGAGGSTQGAVGKALRDALKNQTVSGPGAIQDSFMKQLSGGLSDKLGQKTGGKMMNTLQNQSLSSTDVQKLMNGGATKSQLQDWFGASRKQLPKVEGAVDGAVDAKNRSGFFGILIIVMVGDFGVDPTSDFASQCGGAKDEMSPEDFAKLRAGNVSTSTIGDAFGLESKQDCEFMQEILNAMKNCPFVQHPMLSSMGMGQKGKFDPSKFPALSEGNPGFGMDPTQGAGGMPCDFELPPCPFMAGSFDDHMKSCKKKAAEGSPKPEEQPNKDRTDDAGKQK